MKDLSEASYVLRIKNTGKVKVVALGLDSVLKKFSLENSDGGMSHGVNGDKFDNPNA